MTRSWRNFFMKSVDPPSEKENSEIWPERRVNIFSRMTFSWISPILKIGFQRTLEFTDLFQLDDFLKAKTIEPLIAEKYKVERKTHHPAAALYLTLCKAAGFGYFNNFFLKMTSDLSLIGSGFLLRFLISLVQRAAVDNSNRGKGVGFAIGIFSLQMLSSIALMHFFHRVTTMGGKLRAGITVMIYKKSLIITSKARLRYSNGRIQNLLSTDCFRIDNGAQYFLMLFTCFLTIFTNVALLIVNIGPSALAGVGVLVIFTPISTVLAKVLGEKRKESSLVTDRRMRDSQEVLSSMRPIKFYAWEKAFLDKIMGTRKEEVKIVQKILYLRAFLATISLSMPVLATILSFTAYALTGNYFDAAKVFSSLSLFNLLRMPLMILPQVIAYVMDAWVSIKRISDFLEQEEIDASKDPTKKPNYDSQYAIELHDCNFEWEYEDHQDFDVSNDKIEKKLKFFGKNRLCCAKPKTTTQFVNVMSKNSETNVEEIETQSQFENNQKEEDFHLENLSLLIKRGELVAIIGLVGSGKSSIFHALLGEMKHTSGKLGINGKIAYCPQQAWIQNATIRNNIIFGLPFDEERYNQVMYACALTNDINEMPNGDMTEVGERGITISGGQKQRINLARAAYSNADIFFLDDPLSAVDAHVGKHIFENCISDFLKGKTVLLITHQLNVCKDLDRIILLKDGYIQFDDSFINLNDKIDIFRKHLTKDQVETSTDQDNNQKRISVSSSDAKLVEKEHRAEGALGWSIWNAYISAGGGYFFFLLTILSCMAYVVAGIMSNFILTYWSEDKYNKPLKFYIGIYVMLSVLSILFLFIFSVFNFKIGINSSKRLFKNATRGIFKVPLSFFDTTPVGRITNRFSKDVDVLDNLLSDSYRMLTFIAMQMIGTLILTSILFYWLILALIPFMLGFFTASLYYRASARDLKRIDSVTRSYLFSHFGESLHGVSTIRAYQKEEDFVQKTLNYVDDSNKAFFLTLVNARWLSLRLDGSANILTLIVALLSVLWKSPTQAAVIGLVLSYQMMLAGSMTWMVRQFSEVENSMNSVERLYEYGHKLPEEAAPFSTKLQNRPNWPEKAEINFNSVSLSYRPGLPFILKDLTFNAKSGERIGIVGRTGAGKSSIINALFRIPEISGGSITIDGIDTSEVGLYELRSRLAIIPQDPLMFNATIRYNLDPFGKYTDAEIFAALKSSLFIECAKSDNFSLDDQVEEEGGNFSLGQRQLLALARALIRKSNILVLDEASSSVDFDTDLRIQETIRTQFAGVTILCIAHRLKTIIHYDRILVMNNGAKEEFDTPVNLFNADGIFRSLCDKSGITLKDLETK